MSKQLFKSNKTALIISLFADNQARSVNINATSEKLEEQPPPALFLPTTTMMPPAEQSTTVSKRCDFKGEKYEVNERIEIGCDDICVCQLDGEVLCSPRCPKMNMT